MKCEHEPKTICHKASKYVLWCKKCGAVKETDRWLQPQNNEDLITLKKATWYECYSCNQAYPTQEKAKNCCELEEVIQYKCPQCESLYEEEEEAHDCCGGPQEVDGYVCPVCGEFYEDAAEALECCQS